MHYRMNNSNDYGHLRVRSNIVRLRGSQILSRVYLMHIDVTIKDFKVISADQY